MCLKNVSLINLSKVDKARAGAVQGFWFIIQVGEIMVKTVPEGKTADHSAVLCTQGLITVFETSISPGKIILRSTFIHVFHCEEFPGGK